MAAILFFVCVTGVWLDEREDRTKNHEAGSKSD